MSPRTHSPGGSPPSPYAHSLGQPPQTQLRTLPGASPGLCPPLQGRGGPRVPPLRGRAQGPAVGHPLPPCPSTLPPCPHACASPLPAPTQPQDPCPRPPGLSPTAPAPPRSPPAQCLPINQPLGHPSVAACGGGPRGAVPMEQTPGNRGSPHPVSPPRGCSLWPWGWGQCIGGGAQWGGWAVWGAQCAHVPRGALPGPAPPLRPLPNHPHPLHAQPHCSHPFYSSANNKKIHGVRGGVAAPPRPRLTHVGLRCPPAAPSPTDVSLEPCRCRHPPCAWQAPWPHSSCGEGGTAPAAPP